MFRYLFIIYSLIFISCEREAVNINADTDSDLLLIDQEPFDIYDDNLERIKNDNFPKEYFSSIILNTKFFRKKISNQFQTSYEHNFSIGTKIHDAYKDFGNVYLDSYVDYIELNTFDSLNTGQNTNYNYKYVGSDNEYHRLPQQLLNNRYNEINLVIKNSNEFEDQNIPFNFGPSISIKTAIQKITLGTDLILQLDHGKILDPRNSLISILYEKKGKHSIENKYAYLNFVPLYFTGQIRITNKILNKVFNERKRDSQIIIFIAEKISNPDFILRSKSNEIIHIPSGRINRVIYTLGMEKIEINS